MLTLHNLLQAAHVTSVMDDESLATRLVETVDSQ